jgi:tetratricopeptide (TPR) repeat protein
MRDAALDVAPEGIAESLATLRRSAALFESFRAAEPETLSYPTQLAVVREYIGHRLLALGRAREALEEYRGSLSLAEWVSGVRKHDSTSLWQTFNAARGMVRALLAEGDRRGALEEARKLMMRAERGVPESAERGKHQSHLPEAYLALASVHLASGDWEAARRAAQESMARLRGLATGRPHDRNARLMGEAAAVIKECGSYLDGE